MKLAAKGVDALREDRSLALGLNTYQGELTFAAVGEAFGMSATTVEKVLGLS